MENTEDISQKPLDSNRKKNKKKHCNQETINIYINGTVFSCSLFFFLFYANP